MRVVDLGYEVYASWSSYYHPRYRGATRRAASLIQRAMPYLHELLVLPFDQRIIIHPIRNGVNGFFELLNQTIHIDPRRETDYQLLSTLAHEGVHSEQYFMNRTGFLVKEDGSFVRYADRFYQVDSDTISDEDMPWEVEAYGRQDVLAQHVAMNINLEMISGQSGYTFGMD